MGFAGMTPVGMTPQQIAELNPADLATFRYAVDIEQRNKYKTRQQRKICHLKLTKKLRRPQSDEELDSVFPPGYEVVPAPAGYAPAKKAPGPLGGLLGATPAQGVAGTPGFFIQPFFIRTVVCP